MTNSPDPREVAEALGNAPPLHLELDAGSAFALVGALQLASRHPGFTGSSADIARQIAQQVGEALSSCHPAIAEIIAQGWNPDNDMTQEEFDQEFPVGPEGGISGVNIGAEPDPKTGKVAPFLQIGKGRAYLPIELAGEMGLALIKSAVRAELEEESEEASPQTLVEERSREHFKPGLLMTCTMCNRKEMTGTIAPSDWRCIEIDAKPFYVCPDHFPKDGSPEGFKEAYGKVLREITRKLRFKGFGKNNPPDEP